MGELIGYAGVNCPATPTAQREALTTLDVPDERIYFDKGLTGTSRARPGLDQVLATLRSGDTLVVPKLDRLARSVPDARRIGDSLVAQGIKLTLGGAIYDPAGSVGEMFFNILATFAEFEVDLLGLRTREGMALARAKEAQGQAAPADSPPASRAGLHARYRRLHRRRAHGSLLRRPRRLSALSARFQLTNAANPDARVVPDRRFYESSDQGIPHCASVCQSRSTSERLQP
jgi:DNA invertase Pin-like site-specific DNA recombinase